MRDFLVWLLAFRVSQNLPNWHEYDFCDNVQALIECSASEIGLFYESNEPKSSKLQVSNFNFLQSQDKANLISDALKILVSENIVKVANTVTLV